MKWIHKDQAGGLIVLRSIDAGNDATLRYIISSLSIFMLIIVYYCAGFVMHAMDGVSYLNPLLLLKNSSLLLKAIVLPSVALSYGFHEILHAGAVMLITHKKPSFGLKRLLFYVALPENLILAKWYDIFVSLTPLVVNVILWVLSLILLPVQYSILGLIMLALNVALCTGDIVIACQVIRLKECIYCGDTGVVVTCYGKDNTHNKSYIPN